MIVAVDFDGILCENKFPDIGRPNYSMIILVRKIVDAGHEVVLWTTRNGKELENAIDWCKKQGLDFHTVNSQARSNQEKYGSMYATASRKVYADVYIDDRSPDFIVACTNRGYEYAIEYTARMVRKALGIKDE